MRENYNILDPDYPCGICVTCSVNLRKGKKVPTVPFVPDRTRQLRSSDDCECQICTVGKQIYKEQNWETKNCRESTIRWLKLA